MDKYEAPLIEGLTLAHIGDLLCNKYNRKRSELGDFIYRDVRTFRRKANGEARIYQKDVDCLIETLTNFICGGDEGKFYMLVKEWFPALQHFESKRDIRTVFTANLMNIASDKGQAEISDSHDGYITTVQFFQSCFEYSSPIRCIKLSAQTGWTWFDDKEKRKLLKKLADSGIEIQVIGNPMTPGMKKMVLAMRDPQMELDYKGVNETLSEWHKYEINYCNLSLHISVDYPVLHQTYIVEFEDGSAKALIRDYAYGLPVAKLAPCKHILKYAHEYKHYRNEFQFLWDKGITYDEWERTLPKPEEMLSTGNYILMYPSHQKENSDASKWVYCALAITDNNKVSMKVNIPDICKFPNRIDDWEYSYEGSIKVTGRMIFASLYDEEQGEAVNISIPRPVRNVDRYIGIMSALNPSGNAPVAFKCACIGQSVLPKMDYDRLRLLLSNNNKMYRDNLMILEPQDIDLFYSNRIFSEQIR